MTKNFLTRDNIIFLQFEGTPFHPGNDRYWAVVDKYKVNQFYTAPTAIRSLMKFGEEPVKKLVQDLSLSSLLDGRFMKVDISGTGWTHYKFWVQSGNPSIRKLGYGIIKLWDTKSVP